MPDPNITETTATNTPPLDTTGTPSAAPAAPAGPTPASPASNPTTVAANTPHARLLNMIQGLAVGVDSFAKAAATHGREGGVGEVQDFYAKQQQAEQQQQKAQQEAQEHDLRMKTMNANLLINQMQYQHAMQLFPLQQKEAQLKLQNDTIHEFVDEKTTGESMGYDMNDPAQANEARQRMGVGSAASQPGAITVPFSKGQSTQDVTDAMTKALPPGASLTDYKVMPMYNDDKHGTGGTITLVPNNSPIMQMGATPKQISMAQAETEGALNMAKQAGLSDSPAVQRLQGQYDTMKSVLDKGGKPTTSDLFTMHMGVNGPIAKLVADKGEADKLQKANEDIQAAARPKNLEDATAMAVQARQAYAKNPTPANLEAMGNAEQQRTAAYQDKLDQITAQATATAKATNQANGKGMEAMFKNGINPIANPNGSHDKLSLDNAPDEFLIDTRTGQPIPTGMLSTLKPSMQETNRSDFAASVIHSLDQIDQLRAANKLPNGPLSGLTTSILAKAGLGNQDAQKAIDFVSFAQSAATGAHVGGRFNKEIMQKMGSMIGLNMNDSQFTGAEDAIRSVMDQYVKQGGRYTVAQWKGMSPEDQKTAMTGAVGTTTPAGLQGGGKFNPSALPDAH